MNECPSKLLITNINKNLDIVVRDNYDIAMKLTLKYGIAFSHSSYGNYTSQEHDFTVYGTNNA